MAVRITDKEISRSDNEVFDPKLEEM